MGTKEMLKKGLHVGTGTGLILFGLIGLLLGSMLGGVVGVEIVRSILSMPWDWDAWALPILVIGASMIMGITTAIGVIASAITFILGGGLLGWIVGFVIDEMRYGKAEAIKVVAGEK